MNPFPIARCSERPMLLTLSRLAVGAMTNRSDFEPMLKVAIGEARIGLSEGGIPIGAALFRRDGTLLGRGHNRRVQENDPSVHAETDAFRAALSSRSALARWSSENPAPLPAGSIGCGTGVSR